MKPILFEKDATVFSTFGLGVLPDAISCIVTEERNGAFELEMVYPVNGFGFDELVEDRIIVAKSCEDGTRQAFRIYRITRVLDGQATVYARHISYQLCSIPVEPTSGSGTAQAAMNAYKTAAQEPCPFTFQSDISTVAAYELSAPAALRSALGGMEGSVLDVFGGEFEWDNWTVKLWQNRGSDNGVRIAYGKNLTALERTTDIGDLITGVMAYWQGEENGVIETVYSSPKVISNGNQSDLSHPRTVVLDISGEFDTKPTQAQVTSYTTTYLAATTLAQMNEAITVDFVPLWHTREYEDIFREHIKLCDTVTVVYKRLGVNVKRKVTKTVFDVLLDRFSSIELGGEANIADTVSELGSETNDTARILAQMVSTVDALRAKLSGQFTVVSTTVSGSSTSAGGTFNISSRAITVVGYTPLCVCGWSSSGMTYLTLGNMYLDSGGDIHVSGRNLGSSAVTPSYNVRVLYVKD